MTDSSPLHAPPLDTVVVCPHGKECPGCPLLELTYGEQLVVKKKRVVHALSRCRELTRAGIFDVVPADPIVAYRSRAKLVASGPLLGLFAKGTHRVVDIPGCRVMEPSVLAVANTVRHAALPDLPLRAVDLQRAEGVLVTLVVPDRTDENAVRDLAMAVAAASPEITGVAVSYRDERSHQVLGRAPVTVSGNARERVHVLGDGAPFHYVSPGSFTQAHRGQQRRLLEAVLTAITARFGARNDLRVLDLYAGGGALALALAARGAKVVAVEAYRPAATLARDAASEQSLDVRVESTDAADVVREMVVGGERADVVIVNPPRRGLAPAVRAGIARLAPSLLAYVSCEPLTLARDLADLARHGLEARSIAPYDMMPLTSQVEALAFAAPGDAPPPEIVHADERLIAVIKSPHEPTTPQGEHVGSLLDRVRRLDGASDAVPVHRLDIGTSGVCLFARSPEVVPALAEALTAGEKEYLALCKGVTRDKGSVRRPLVEQGRPLEARTRYSRRSVIGGHSLIRVRPDEGRKHQIRRHLASIGHPIAGDERYGEPRMNEYFFMRHFLDRPFLHCARIVLALPGAPLELSAPLAPDLEGVLESLAEANGDDDE